MGYKKAEPQRLDKFSAPLILSELIFGMKSDPAEGLMTLK